ncbi:MAG: tRNA guanosine(15) transglycosylase TgtA [Nitrososphaerota archaeon]|nr:tRNA guanosine(15) transglycosylase TgtA [Nitrososphaerota archaeon]
MRLDFEVKESDLLGRIGTLKVGSKTLETPYMFPVIHPVDQLIPTSELRSMGYGGLMTNSYILMKRRRDEVLEKGIHRLLDFDGTFITDSGGYQVLEYGDLDVGYGDVAKFEAGIGTELAVTLDRPTGYPQSRRVAKETVDYSLKNASATLREFGKEETAWVGPIQGGLYPDLVRRSARSLVKAGFGFLALGSPVQVMENYMYADLVEMVFAAKRAIPYSVPLHLFGAGHPLTMALAVALGCDTFDSASYVLFARSGRYMWKSGVLAFDVMKYLPCSCPVCSRTGVRELRELPDRERTKALSTHNLYVLREELEACKEAISEGRLWDLVEERSMAHPKLREAFARLAAHSKELAAGTPAQKEKGLFVRSVLDLARPELATAAERLARMSVRSSTKAVVSGSAEGRMKGADRYLVHPVLGPYPAELRFVYPFGQTEAAEEQRIWGPAEVRKKLKSMGYSKVTVEGERTAGRKRPKSRPSRRGASPSPPSASARSR